MNEPIATLTREQAEQLPRFVESWRKNALATARIDPVAARRAVRKLYRAYGLAEPKAVICLDSPIACLIARAILVMLARHTVHRLASDDVSFRDRNFEEHLCEDLEESFSIRVWHAMSAQLVEQLGAPSWRPLAALVGDLIGLQLYHGVEFTDSLGGHLDQLSLQLREQLGDRTVWALWWQAGNIFSDMIDTQIRDDFGRDLDGRKRHRPGAFLRKPRDFLPQQLRSLRFQQACFSGGQEGSLLALYDFAEHIGVRYDAQSKRCLEAYKEYARSCGWLYAFRSLAFVSDRPTEIHFDAYQHLHHATGPAVRYCDGWGAHVWHGTGVPSWLIDDRDEVTPQAIEDLGAPARHAALEIYGFDRYLALKNAKLVAADELHGQPRRLLEVIILGRPYRIVEVVNGSLEPDGTRRKYYLGAMPGDTPAEVIAASYGIAPGHYREAVRT